MKTFYSGLLTLFFFIPTPLQAWSYEESEEFPYKEGLGTEEVPYVITNSKQLAKLAWDVNHGITYERTFFVLGNDIDLNPGVVFAPDGSVSSGTPQGWTPIGTEKTPFKGVFKGNGHAITGLYFSEPHEYTGLFGYTEDGSLSGVTIKNSGIHFNIVDNSEKGVCIGMLVGCAANLTKMADCRNESGLTATLLDDGYWSAAGGLIGRISTSNRFQKEELIINNCENHGQITIKNSSMGDFGGLFGSVGLYHTISNCNNYGDISSFGKGECSIGGIAGSIGYRDNGEYLRNYGNIYCESGFAAGIFAKGGYQLLRECVNEGDITGHVSAGGICASSEICNVENCINKGNIKATAVLYEPEKPIYDLIYNFQYPAGGLFGAINYVESITGCSNYGEIHSNGCAAGIAALAADYSQEGSYVNNCTNNGAITATWASGGIFANLYVEKGTELYNLAPIVGGHKYTGGIVGYLGAAFSSRTLYLSQCHNTADITGSEYVSGIVGGGSGTNYYSELSNIGNVSGTAHVTGVSNGTQNIELSYNTGNLYGIENVSGITNSGNITNCFNAGDIDAEVNSGGISAYANGNLHNVFNFGRVPKSNIEKCIGSIVGNAYWGVDHLDIKNVFYLTNNATPIGGPYITDANVFVEKTEAEFASGELCIALNEGQEPTPWGQNIGNNPYPLLNGDRKSVV